MTTPKELAEEFRRLAAEAKQKAKQYSDEGYDIWSNGASGHADAFEQAAQMVEDKLK